MSVKSSPDLMSQIYGTFSQYMLSVIKSSSNHKGAKKHTQQEVDFLHNLNKTNEDIALNQCASSAIMNTCHVLSSLIVRFTI